MDAKIGIAVGFLAGAVLGVGGTYVISQPGPAPEPAPAAEPVREVVTQVVERTVMVEAPARPPEEVMTARPEENRTVAFRPPEENPGDRGEDRRRDWPERGTPEWSNRMVEVRAEWSNRAARFRAEWTNRAVAARTNFIAQARLSEDQTTRFDVLMTALNMRLANTLDPIIAQFQAGGERPHISPEDRARIALDVSSAIVNTYDEMNRAMPSDWSNVASSNSVSIGQFVDPKYMMFVGPVVGGGRGGRGGPGGGGPGGGRSGPPGGGAPAP